MNFFMVFFLSYLFYFHSHFHTFISSYFFVLFSYVFPHSLNLSHRIRFSIFCWAFKDNTRNERKGNCSEVLSFYKWTEEIELICKLKRTFDLFPFHIIVEARTFYPHFSFSLKHISLSLPLSLSFNLSLVSILPT